MLNAVRSSLTDILNVLKRSRWLSGRKTIHILFLETEGIHREQRQYLDSASASMLQIIQRSFSFLKNIPASNFNDWKAYRDTKRMLKYMRNSFGEVDFLLPSVQGIKSLLLAILYANYLKIQIKKESLNCKNGNLALKKKIDEMKIILLQLEEDIQKYPFAQDTKPSSKDIINMMDYSERRHHKLVNRSVYEKIKEKMRLLKTSSKKERQVLLTKVLFELKIKSLTCLIKMAKSPEKYLYLRDKTLRGEALKNVLFIESPVEYRILEKCNGLKELLNSFAFADEQVTAYFFNVLHVDEMREKESFLALIDEQIEQTELEFNQIALKQKFVESEGGLFAFNEMSDTISEITDDDYDADLDMNDIDDKQQLDLTDEELDGLAVATSRKKPVNFEESSPFWKSQRTLSTVASGVNSVDTQPETVSVK